MKVALFKIEMQNDSQRRTDLFFLNSGIKNLTAFINKPGPLLRERHTQPD
jgi:hypothetical protein